MNKFIEYFLWIAFAIFWVLLWGWFFSQHYSFSQDEYEKDPFWYTHIGEYDTSKVVDSYYIEVLKDTVDTND